MEKHLSTTLLLLWELMTSLTSRALLLCSIFLCLMVFLLTREAIGFNEKESNLQIAISSGHSDRVLSVAFSPDGRLALSGSWDGIVKLWKVSTGRELRTFRHDRISRVGAVAFSPDGRLALSGGDGMKLWEVATGHVQDNFRRYIDGFPVAFSPDGRLALSGGDDGPLQLWSIATRRKLRTFHRDRFSVNAVAFSPDGRWALAGSRYMELWDVETGQLLRTFDIDAKAVAFSPDGRWALAGSRYMELWDVETGQLLRTFGGGRLNYPAYVNAVAFSPDGRLALSGGSIMELWDVETGQLLRTFGRDANAVAFSPDGHLVLSGNNDHTLKLWEVATGHLLRTFHGQIGAVNTAAFSPDGRLALAGSWDHTLKLWEVVTGRLLRTFHGHTGQVIAVALSPDGRWALSSSDDHTLKLWDIAGGGHVRTFCNGCNPARAVAFSPDGRLAVSSGSGDKTLWEVATGRKLRTLDTPSDQVIPVAFSPDGRLVLSVTQGRMRERSHEDRPRYSLNHDLDYTTVYLSEVATGLHLRTFCDGCGRVDAVAFSPDGSLAVSGGRYLTLWEVATGRKLRTFYPRYKYQVISALAFSPDSRLVLSNSHNTLRLWDVASGRHKRAFHGHTGWIVSVAFSSDGRLALSGARDGFLIIWEVETGREIGKLFATPDGEWISFTPDGYYDGSREGSAWIYWVSHTDNGRFSFEQFSSYFHQPDIVRARFAGDLKAGTPAHVLTRPPSIDMPEHMAIRNIQAATYPLRLTAKSTQEVKTVRIFVNGKPALEKPVQAQEKALEFKVPVSPGANHITAIAYDTNGFSSNPRYVDVIANTAQGDKPDLYVFAVGVSDYPKLASTSQLGYAHSDAYALVKVLSEQEGLSFRHVNTHLLTNENATTNAIIDRLDGLSAVEAHDMVVLFLAGHGVRSADGTFYFLTSSGNIQSPHKGGLNWAVLDKYLSRIKGRVILFLDACHAGSITTETVVPNDALAHQLFTSGRSGTMVFSASKGRQDSLEHDELGGGFGVFTYALVQGLGPQSSDADINRNGFVEFLELVDYVGRFVGKKTQGEQTPWLSRKELFGDLPIAQVRQP